MANNLRPLSNLEIQRKVNCKFILYSDMPKIKTIEQLMPKTLILYQLANIGHFVCVFENRFGEIECFDPLGLSIDDALYFMNRRLRIALNHNFTYLARLLVNTDRVVNYNDYQYQMPQENLCGYWCAIRLEYSRLTCDEFYNEFGKYIGNIKMIIQLYDDI